MDLLSRIGKFTHEVNASNVYRELSLSDEKSALLLFKGGEYRQSCYFIVQAMEKIIRAKIFTLVNANNEYFRDRNRNHSLEDAVDFLIEILSTNDHVKAQIGMQLRQYVLGGLKYNFLHNNLRYPLYSKKHNSYSKLEVSKNDCDILFSKLDSLKKFLADMHRIA